MIEIVLPNLIWEKICGYFPTINFIHLIYDEFLKSQPQIEFYEFLNEINL